MMATLRGRRRPLFVGAACLVCSSGPAIMPLGAQALRQLPAVAPTVFTADLRQLPRWGFDERALPPGTHVLFRTASIWQRDRTAILTTLGIITAESLLIALLLVERDRRIGAQRGLQDEAAYEQTIADLTTDAVRHAPEEAPRALEDAVGRIARYADATRAILVQFPDGGTRPAMRLYWPYTSEAASECGWMSIHPLRCDTDDSRLDIQLVAGGTHIGVLELYRTGVSRPWPERLVTRLDAACEILASSLARARAARVIREEEELNRAVLASLSTQIAILDYNGTIIRVNDAWSELAHNAGVAIDREAFVGHNYLDECGRAERRGCEEAGKVRRGIESVLDRRVSHFQHEYHWSSPETRWYELRVDCLEHEDGGAIITHLDITDRRVVELEAEEARRQVAHLGRVAMVGELAATVSHELRQPLAAIRANAEAGLLVLAQPSPDLTEARQIFGDIVADDVRAAETINQIRMLLRKGALRADIVDVNDVCRQAVHLLQRDALMRRTKLELSLDTGLAAVTGDPIQLQQVVLNLTLNALESASTSTDDATVTVSTTMQGGEVEICVHDTGPGLSPDVQQHLFESFFSSKPHGLGMGLVIVSSIVERHHGRVRAENASAGGAVFRVLLPAADTGEIASVNAARFGVSPLQPPIAV